MISFLSLSAQSSWLTEPYLGLGQLSLKLGDEVLINGQTTGYVLGVRTGMLLGEKFLLALDYSRSGPFQIDFKHRYYGTSISSAFFNLYSSGLGLGYNFGNWLLWYGYYPYHTLEEHKVDFQMKGLMNRFSVGFNLDAKTILYFSYENSSISMSDPSVTAESIICYNSMGSQCKKSGNSNLLYFSIAAQIK